MAILKWRYTRIRPLSVYVMWSIGNIICIKNENCNILVKFRVKILLLSKLKTRIFSEVPRSIFILVYCILTANCYSIFFFILLINRNFFLNKRYFTKIKISPRYLENIRFCKFGNRRFNSEFEKNVTTHIMLSSVFSPYRTLDRRIQQMPRIVSSQ